jgi:hypothetical protein
LKGVESVELARDLRPNNSPQRMALRAAADAEGSAGMKLGCEAA